MSSSKARKEEDRAAEKGKRKISEKIRGFGKRARDRTFAETGAEGGAAAEVKLEKDLLVGNNEADIASSPPMPTAAKHQAQESQVSTPEPEDVEVGYVVNSHKRRKKAEDSTPASTPSQPSKPSKRLGGPFTPEPSSTKPAMDKRTACYLQVFRDLEPSDETVGGAIVGMVKSNWKDVTLLSSTPLASKVPLIQEQLRLHGVSTSRCEELKVRLQQAEGRHIARRIADLFSEHDLLQRVSDALCAEVEKAGSSNPETTESRRSMSARASSVITTPAEPNSLQDLPVTQRARTAAPDIDAADLPSSSTTRGP